MIAIWQTRRIYLMVVFTQLVSRNWQALKQRNFSNVERISSFRNLAQKRKKFFAGKYIWIIWRNNAVKCFASASNFQNKGGFPQQTSTGLHSSPKMGKKRTKEGNRRHIWLECFKGHGVWNCKRSFAAKVDLIESKHAEKTNVKNCSTVEKCKT